MIAKLRHITSLTMGLYDITWYNYASLNLEVNKHNYNVALSQL